MIIWFIVKLRSRLTNNQKNVFSAAIDSKLLNIWKSVQESDSKWNICFVPALLV